MSPADGGFALLARLHGHAALLGVVLLAHPVWWLGRPGSPRRARQVATLAAAVLVASWCFGAWLYPTWRVTVKPPLAAAQHPVVLAFEVKEHLAAVCAACAAAGAATLWTGPASQRTARALLALGLLCGAATAALGLVSAGVMHPAFGP